jgi:hypothetical protein
MHRFRGLLAALLWVGCTTPPPGPGTDGGAQDAASAGDASVSADAGGDAGSEDAGGDAGVYVTTVNINEFMARNATTHADEAGEFEDWIELYNQGPDPVDLSGFGLSDIETDPMLFTFPAGTTLAAGAFIVVFADGQVSQGTLHAVFRLAGDGERIVLSAPQGSQVDNVVFGAQEVDISNGRFPDGTGNVVRLGTPTPGAPNEATTRDAGPTDASVGDAAVPNAQGVVINELVASNTTGHADEMGEFEDWIEFFNTSLDTQDLSGHQLSDDPLVTAKWIFPSQSLIAPAGYLVVFADNQPEQGVLHATFKLSANGESVMLSRPDGTLLDSVTFLTQETNVSLGRTPNGTGSFVPQAESTPGAENAGGHADAGTSDAGANLDASLADAQTADAAAPAPDGGGP